MNTPEQNAKIDLILYLLAAALTLFCVAGALCLAAWLSDLHIKFVSCLIVSGLVMHLRQDHKAWMVEQLNGITTWIAAQKK